jgi:hypothetical protein
MDVWTIDHPCVSCKHDPALELGQIEQEGVTGGCDNNVSDDEERW